MAIAELYFSPHYFDHSLIGAQSDQQVLKDMVKEKLPDLYNHLDSIDIELSTITLNWFLAVFFDAVPFQVHIVFLPPPHPFHKDLFSVIRNQIFDVSIYGKCSKFSNTILFLFSNNMLVNHKMLVRIASREDPDHTVSSKAV